MRSCRPILVWCWFPIYCALECHTLAGWALKLVLAATMPYLLADLIELGPKLVWLHIPSKMEMPPKVAERLFFPCLALAFHCSQVAQAQAAGKLSLPFHRLSCFCLVAQELFHHRDLTKNGIRSFLIYALPLNLTKKMMMKYSGMCNKIVVMERTSFQTGRAMRPWAEPTA